MADRINDIVDIKAVEGQLNQSIDKVKELLDLIQDVNKKGISLSGNKNFSESAKLRKELEDLVKQTELSAKAAIAEEKARLNAAKATQQEAKAAEQLTKQKLAEIKLREATERAAQKEASAAEKLAASKRAEQQATGNVAASERSTEAKRKEEQAAIDLAKSLEFQKQAQEELNAAIESASKSGNKRAQLISDPTPIQQSAQAVTVYRDELEKLTGTIDENQKLHAIYTSELEDVDHNLKILKSTTDNSAKGSKKYQDELRGLQGRQKQLKADIADVNKTIALQVKENNSAAGSIDQLRARYALLLRQVEQGGPAFKASGPGKIIAAETVAVKTALDTAERQALLFRGSLSNVGSAIVDTGKKAFGFIRQAANIIPGLGLSGAFLLIFEGIQKVVEVLTSANSKIDETAKRSKLISDVYKEAAKNVGESAAKLIVYKDTLTDLSIPEKERLKVLHDYNETADNTNKIDATQINNLQLINEKIDAQNKLILKRAISLAATAKLGESASKFVDAQLQFDLLSQQRKLDRDDVIKELTDYRTKIDAIFSTPAAKYNQYNDQTQAAAKKASSILARNIGVSEKEVEKLIVAFNDLNTASKDLSKTEQALSPLIDAGSLVKDTKTPKTPKKDNTLKDLQDLAAKRRKAEFEATKAIQEDNIKAQEAIYKDDSQSFKKRIEALRQFVQEKARLIELERTFEKGEVEINRQIQLAEAGKIKNEKTKNAQIKAINEAAAAEIARIEAQKQTDLNELVRQGHTDYNNILEKKLKDEEKLHKDNADRIKAIHEKLQKDIQKGLDDADKRLADTIAKRKEYQAALKDLFKQLGSELTGLTFDIVTSDIEKQKNAIQDEIDLLEQKRLKDIQVAESTISNAQDRAAAITVINDKAAAEQAILEQKQRQLDVRKAQFDKAESIANVIQSTAEAIIKYLSNPVTAPLVPLVTAIGAAQLARIVATPIPRYKTGTDYHRGGLMEVGDGGKHEGIRLPDGTILKTPNVSTIMHAPRGTKVYPDFDKMMLKATLSVPQYKEVTRTDNSTAIAVVDMKREVVKAIKKIPQSHYTVENIISKRIRSGNSFNEYIRRATS